MKFFQKNFKKCLTNRFGFAIIDYADLRGCWNRQTGKLEVLVSVLACGFKSHFPHQCKGHSIFRVSFIFVLAKTYALQYAEKAVAVSLLPQLLYSLYLRLKYIEDFTESLEMHYFTFTQEFYHIAYVRIVADS